MNKTSIEYLDYTLNPIAMRCTPVSEGCAHCWHLMTNHRFHIHSGPPKLREKELTEPMKVKKPPRIGVQFMGDLWHEDVDWIWIDRIFETCRHPEANHHIHIFLTKRVDTAWHYFRSPIYGKEHLRRSSFLKHQNLWLGITAENQKRFDERWYYLKQISAAVIWISHEPALGPIVYPPEFLALGNRVWVVSGGESGHGARPSHPDWFRQDRDQCVEAGVPFFFKQWGAWVPDDFSTVTKTGHTPKRCWVHIDGEIYDYAYPYNTEGVMWASKKAAGRVLDGRTWDQAPWFL